MVLHSFGGEGNLSHVCRFLGRNGDPGREGKEGKGGFHDADESLAISDDDEWGRICLTEMTSWCQSD
jgi:hypothetical protein